MMFARRLSFLLSFIGRRRITPPEKYFWLHLLVQVVITNFTLVKHHLCGLGNIDSGFSHSQVQSNVNP